MEFVSRFPKPLVIAGMVATVQVYFGRASKVMAHLADGYNLNGEGVLVVVVTGVDIVADQLLGCAELDGHHRLHAATGPLLTHHYILHVNLSPFAIRQVLLSRGFTDMCQQSEHCR